MSTKTSPREEPNEDTKIWRYLDFTKFISLLDTSKLFFTRADLFEDTFEGSLPKKNAELRSRYADIDERSKISELWPRFTAVSCWHENEHESAAMWKLYLKSGEGVAIQSTYAKLKQSVIDQKDIVRIGKVQYIDYETEMIKEEGLTKPFFYKRKSFSHENEIRAIIFELPIGVSTPSDIFDKGTIRDGLPIKVDLSSLVQKVYLAPNAPLWFRDLVCSLIKKYEYNFEVVHSDLDKSPVF
jgi:hypothetical protein